MKLPRRRHILFLSGMHRSGTSFLAKLYHESGVLFPGDLLPPSEDNPDGYWEARECVSLNNLMLEDLGQTWKSIEPVNAGTLRDISIRYQDRVIACLSSLARETKATTFALKDPRFCRLLPIWSEAAVSMGFECSLHATIRRVEDVTKSLFRRTRNESFKPAAIDTPNDATLLWLRYLLDLEANSRQLSRRFTRFADLRDPEVLKPIQRSALEATARQALTPRTIAELSQFVTAAFERTLEPHEQENFDRWRSAFDQSLMDTADISPISTRSAVRFAKAPTSLPSQSSQPIISFVSGAPLSKGHIYRIENRNFSLSGGNAAVIRASPQTHDAEDLAAVSDAIIIFRRPMDKWQHTLMGAAARSNTAVIFDIDDLIFEPELIRPEIVRYLERHGEQTITEWKEQAGRFQEALSAATHAWLSTQPLAERARRFRANSICLPNGLSDHQLSVSNRHQKALPQSLVIGYASGTPSHDRDFEVALPALRRTLEKYPNVSVQVRGEVDQNLIAELGHHEGRVSHQPAVSYYDLSRALADFDINLVPLEPQNPFCECKSELKFFEAGVMRIPSVMSPTAPLAACAEDGSAGLLASTTEDWQDALEYLIDNPARRIEMGIAARRRAIAKFGPEQQQADFMAALETILPGMQLGK